MSNLAPFILVAFLLIFLFALAFGVIAGVTLALGRLLMLFAPFTWFEATLLAAIFAACTYYLLTTIIQTLSSPLGIGSGPLDVEPRAEVEPEYRRIAAERFYRTSNERTWATWLEYEITNDIYAEFQSAQHVLAHMSDMQLQELAIRIAGFAIAILKRKRGQTRNLSINMTALKREMTRSGQKAYDDDILRLAMQAINLDLHLYEDELLEVIRANGWEELATIDEDEG